MPRPRPTGALPAIIIAILVATAPAAASAGDTKWNHTRHSNNIVDVETANDLVISADSGEVHADTLGTGTQQWTASYSGTQAASEPRNGVVVIAHTDGVVTVDSSDGSQTSSHAQVNTERYVAAANNGDYAYYGKNKSTGHQIVRTELTNVDNDLEYASLDAVPVDIAVDDRNAYAVLEDGTVDAYDNSLDGKEWSDDSTFQSTAGVATNGETVVVAGTDTNGDPLVAAYDRVDGSQLWTHSHHATSVTDVGINDGHVASSDSGGNVITATLTDGSQVSSHTKHAGSVEAVAVASNATISGDSTSSNEVIAVEQPASLENPTPTDGRPDSPVTLNVTVSDPGTADSHTVRFYNQSNGQEIGSETLTGDGTASVSWSHDPDTASSWNATVEDNNGNVVDTTGTITFNAPKTLYIREERPDHNLIREDMNVTIRFFEDDQIYERDVSDGRVDLSGLPDTPFIVEITPPDGSNYTARTVHLLSIYKRHTVFLLDTSAVPIIESRFILDDATGEFDPDSVIYLEKPIELNGDLRWRVVHADQFGAEGVTVQLEADKRYRVRLRNDEATEQVVGPYRSDVNETVTVRPGAPTIELGEPTDGWYANATLDGQTLEYRYSDPENLTSTVNVTIHQRGNTSNLLQPNETYTDLGSFTSQASLTQDEAEKEWVVIFEVTRDGETVEKTIYVRNGVDLVPGLNREWRLIVAVLLLLLSAGAFSVLNAGVGAVVVSLEGGILYWTGWLQGATSAAAIAIAIFFAILVHTYRASGP